MNELMRPMTCSSCGNTSIALVTNDELYGKRHGDWPLIYLCYNCSSAVGVHKNTDEPMGLMADRATRTARKLAHETFDPLWKSNNWLTRQRAYEWLKWQLKLEKEDCHISHFDIEMCNKVINVCKKHPPKQNELSVRNKKYYLRGKRVCN